MPLDQRLIKCTVLQPDDKEKPAFMEFEHKDGDPLSKNELEELDIGQTPWQYKWPDGMDRLTWKFLSETNDINHKWLRRASTVSWRTISWIIPRRIIYERDQSATTNFTEEFTHDLSVFGDRKQVLAQAFLYHPRNPPGYNGKIQWNDNHYFTPYGDELEAYLVDGMNYTEGDKWSDGRLKMLGTQPYIHIGMHEKKHAMGYRHDLVDRASIMYPYVKWGWIKEAGEWVINPKAFIWTDKDIRRWTEGYGRRFFPWLGYFRARRLRPRRVDGVPYLIAR